MSKVELDTITSGYNLSKINENFQRVEDELNNKVLYRKDYVGEPNEMETNLDMNGKEILNVSVGSSPGSLVTKGYVDQEISEERNYVDQEISEERVYVDQQLAEVDLALSGKFDKTGGPISGPVQMGGNSISGLPNATQLSDPATYEQLLQVESASDSLVREALKTFSGVLVEAPAWPDIPNHSDPDLGDALDVQAQALADRTELLKVGAKKAGAFVVFDDATATVATTLIPIANSVGIPYGLAVYMAGIAAAYTSVRIEDILDYKMRYGIEVLNHSSNSEVLNSAMAETYGASLIKTSKQFFDQCAFEPCGFVAPNSVLDSKFVKYVSDNHDFSFVSSVGVVADSASVNTAASDFYNLKRVSLEASGMTLAKAKQLVDYVMDRQLGEYVVFYTHTDTGWVEDLLEYIRDRSAVMTPTAWVSQYRAIRKLNKPLYSPNLLTNSALLVGNTSVEGWSVINQTFDTFNMTTTASNNGNMLDFTGTASAAGQTATISQNYFISGGLLKLSVFNASAKTHGLKPSNTKLEIGIFVKNASNATIASAVKEYDVSSGEQVTDVTMGVINSNLISYILVQYKIISVGAGSIRLLMTEPKLAMAGTPVPYNATGVAPYRSVLRRVTALPIPPNTPTKIIYDQRLTGSDGLYDLVTGDFVGVKGVWYKLDAQVGLANMTDNDRVVLKFLVGATLHYQAIVKCSTGDNSILLSFPLHFSGGTEVITLTIEHNSSAARGIIPFNTTSLAITSI